MTEKAKYAKEQVLKYYPDAVIHKWRGIGNPDVYIGAKSGPISYWRVSEETAWIDAWEYIQRQMIEKLMK